MWILRGCQVCNGDLFMDLIDVEYVCFMCGREYDENKLLKLDIKRTVPLGHRQAREPFAYRHPHAFR